MRYKNIPLSTLQGRLRWVIDQSGMTQKEFAKTLGVSENYIYLLSSGRNKTISEHLAKLIETLFHCPSGWIIYGDSKTEQAEQTEQITLRMETIQKLKEMDVHTLRSVAAYIRTLDEVKKEDKRK